jgi:Helix-turn-helix domain
MEAQPGDELLSGSWFTTDELAALLGVDPSTLRRWRTGRPRKGPPFICLSSRVTLYSSRDVAGWLATRRIDPGQAA